MSEKDLTKSESYVDIDSPRWDQSTYIGRAKHFFTATNPLNVFASSADLQSAKDVIEQHRKVGIDGVCINFHKIVTSNNFDNI